MNTKRYFSSRKGFTLIELLVVIGILAVLAAIAIPSVAGLIDRANKSADQTNANEMTNAIERFTSEYELYCQDIASGAIKDANSDGRPDDMDSAQGRVFNVTGAVSRSDITSLEGNVGLAGKQINRDTKYPTNLGTLEAIVENYTKTSSATFEPKQSDCSYWYNPDCGLVVVAETDATVAELNVMVVSGKDAKGNILDGSANWMNVTTSESALPQGETKTIVIGESKTYTYIDGMTWGQWVNSQYNTDTYTCRHCSTVYKTYAIDSYNNGIGFMDGCTDCYLASICENCGGDGHIETGDPEEPYLDCTECEFGQTTESQERAAMAYLSTFISEEDRAELLNPTIINANDLMDNSLIIGLDA